MESSSPHECWSSPTRRPPLGAFRRRRDRAARTPPLHAARPEPGARAAPRRRCGGPGHGEAQEVLARRCRGSSRRPARGRGDGRRPESAERDRGRRQPARLRRDHHLDAAGPVSRWLQLDLPAKLNWPGAAGDDGHGPRGGEGLAASARRDHDLAELGAGGEALVGCRRLLQPERGRDGHANGAAGDVAEDLTLDRACRRRLLLERA